MCCVALPCCLFDLACFSLPSVSHLSLKHVQPAPDPPITVESSPSSSTYGDACEQLTNSEEEGEGEGVSGMDSLAFDEDIPSDESQRAMREPLSESGVKEGRGQ